MHQGENTGTNHVDAFRRGLAVSTVALAVAPASAGQHDGTGKALATPAGATNSFDAGVLAARQDGTGSAGVDAGTFVEGGGSGRAPPDCRVGGAAVGGAHPAVAPA